MHPDIESREEPPMSVPACPRPTTRRGFTLVEVLVVVAIVGLLVGFLLPAIQSAREASNRMQCAKQLRELALAALNYESANRQLPVGSHNSHWRTWVVQLLPLIEEQNLYNDYDKRLYQSESRFDVGTNAKLTSTFIPALACPNDPPVRTAFGSGATAHSYVACTGNGGYLATPAGWNTTPPLAITSHGGLIIAQFAGGGAAMRPAAGPGTISATGAAIQMSGSATTAATRASASAGAPQPVPLLPIILPFFMVQSSGTSAGSTSFRGGAYQMSGGSADLVPAEDPTLLREAVAVRLKDITDGLSKTLAFSEVIRPKSTDESRSSDYRGLSWWGPGALFSTHATPNSLLPDVMPRRGDCVSDDQAPCVCPHTQTRPMSVLARSRHPGGVVAASCDGSVAFYPDEIDALVWENFGTTQGDRGQ